MKTLGLYERTVDQLTSLREKVGSYAHVSGTQGGHTLNLHRFASDGVIRHIGLSEVSVEEIERARAVVEIATVQNIYNLALRKHDDVLAYCEGGGIGFIPFWPLHSGALAKTDAMSEITARTAATPAQIALAWLLGKSPVIILIPGTSSIEHLEQNVASCDLTLFDADIEELNRLKLPIGQPSR
jgi:aryl-alcohol dehydrogenase-like predicted oxidoreductase